MYIYPYDAIERGNSVAALVCAVFCVQLLPLVKGCVCEGDLVSQLCREAGCQQSLQKRTILLFLVLTINFCGGCVLDRICSCYEWIRYSFDFAMTVLLLDKFI